MAILDELVTQIENPDLRARIAAEVEKLAKQKKFGLVFEEHLPECTPLWDIPVKAGAQGCAQDRPCQRFLYRTQNRGRRCHLPQQG